MAYLVLDDQWIPLTKEMLLGQKNARVFTDQGAWWVEDLGTAVRSLHNGKALITGPAKLADQDNIVIGKRTVQYREEKPAAVRTSSQSADLVGKEIANHRIDGTIGRAITGMVYKAWSHKLGKHVALKVVDPRLVANDEQFIKRFMGDITIAAGLQHPSVVRIYQCAHTGPHLWYTMELVTGQNLAQRLQSAISPAEAMAITIALAGALQAYHETGLVHGDIKPTSVMIDGTKHLRLLDIGLVGMNNDECKLVQSEGQTRQVYYACPVQSRGGQGNARSDIYSVGCLFFHMLNGRPPFEGRNFEEILQAHEQQPIPKLAERLKLPAKLDEILESMMHKDPFFRYEAIAHVVKELKALSASLEKTAKG